MDEKKSYTLEIDTDFKELIRPLRKDEYLMLEANLNADGCRDPIITWNGVIIDGHNRYEICKRLGIPFSVKEMVFENREEVIAWICSNQLGRRNITEETRKYLIGRQYEAEKKSLSQRNEAGVNQYISPPPYETFVPEEANNKESNKNTAVRLATEHHISHATVEKYGFYAKALEEIRDKEPAMIPKILSGRFKISHANIIELSKRSAEDIQALNRKMEQTQTPFVQYSSSRREIQQSRAKRVKELTVVPSIKDMPEFDPDAEITGLTLTIPSWANSISRTCKNVDFSIATDKAKMNLTQALMNLESVLSNMLDILEEN